jgi:hypothetical protein
MKLKAGVLKQIKTVMGTMVDKPFPLKRSLEIARFISNQLEKEDALIEQKRIQICKDFSLKDKDGNPILSENKQNFIISNYEDLVKEFEKCKKENPDSDTTAIEEKMKKEQEHMMKFKEKIEELSNCELDFEFNEFSEDELLSLRDDSGKAPIFPPRQLIVLGEVGLLKDYVNDNKDKNQEKQTTSDREIKLG